MAGKSNPPYQGPPQSGSVEQKRGSKNNAKTKPSSKKRQASRIAKKRAGRL